MKIETHVNEEGIMILTLSGILEKADEEKLLTEFDEALKKSKHLIIDLEEMEDMSEENLLSILNLKYRIPEGGSLDIINGDETMENILSLVGFKHPDASSEGYYRLERTTLSDEDIKELPDYCVSILDDYETEVYAALDENNESMAYIIITVDYYKKEATIMWIFAKDMLAEYFLLEAIVDKLEMESILKIHVNYKEAAKGDNYSYVDKDSLWKKFVELEKLDE